MNRKSSLAVFSSKEIQEILRNTKNQKLVKWIKDMEIVLKENIYAGDLIPKKLIPSLYKKIYGVNLLFRYSHPEGYRSCYTILYKKGIGLCPIILDIMDHDEYNKIFGYKKTR